MLVDKPSAEHALAVHAVAVHALVVHALVLNELVVHGSAAGGDHMQAVQLANLVAALLRVEVQVAAVQHPKWLEAHALQLEALERRPKCLAVIARLALASLLEVSLEVKQLSPELQVEVQTMLVYWFPSHQASPLPDLWHHLHDAVCVFSFCYLHVQQQQPPPAIQFADLWNLP